MRRSVSDAGENDMPKLPQFKVVRKIAPGSP
jgi:hypothetical protein